MRKFLLASVFLIVLMVATAAYFFIVLPEKIISHWGIDNQPDSWMQKEFFFLIFIGLTIAIALLFIVIPKIDPLKKNYAKFQKYYDLFILIFIGFMLYIFILAMLANLGFAVNIGQFLMPAMAVLFYFMGILLEKSEQNWFVGIRTPWTLSSEKVWKKTHKLGGELFKAFAIVLVIIGVLGFFYQEVLFPIFFATIVAIIVVPTVYSYVEFEKEKNKKK